jgi:hypothetical protein
MFTKIVRAAFLGVFTFVPSLAVADSPGSNQDFSIYNETGFVIGEVHISRANDDKWGPDVLGRDVLGSGEHTRIVFSGYRADDCIFDMKIRRGNEGVSYVVEDINLCKLDIITVTSKGDKVFFHGR